MALNLNCPFCLIRFCYTRYIYSHLTAVNTPWLPPSKVQVLEFFFDPPLPGVRNFGRRFQTLQVGTVDYRVQGWQYRILFVREQPTFQGRCHLPTRLAATLGRSQWFMSSYDVIYTACSANPDMASPYQFFHVPCKMFSSTTPPCSAPITSSGSTTVLANTTSRNPGTRAGPAVYSVAPL